MLTETQPTDAAGAKELDLAKNAAAGDGAAFALLYDAYEQRIFNFCFRILGNRHDAEDATQDAFVRMLKRLPEMDSKDLEFGPYLFTTARNVTYDMIGKRKTAQPVEEIPETGEGHLHRDDIDLELDPERAALAGSQAMSVQEANQRLPERQREVLVLREVEGMSYDDIASTMDMNSNSVAQLISRARTRLRSEMRLGSAAAIAPATADCEKALPLLAMRQDGELGPAGDESWLAGHLADCSTCRLADEEMAEAGMSYRAWVPIVPAAYLFRDTLAKASDAVGADWSGIERSSTGGSGPGTGAGAGAGAGAGFGRRTIAIAAAGAVAAFLVVSAVLAGEVSDSSRKTQVLEPADALVLESQVVKEKGKKKVIRRKDGTIVVVDDPDDAVVVTTGGPAPGGDSGQPRNGNGNTQPSNPGDFGGNGVGNPQPNPPSKPEPPVTDPPVVDPPPTDPPVVDPPPTDPPPDPNDPIPGGPTPG